MSMFKKGSEYEVTLKELEEKYGENLLDNKEAYIKEIDNMVSHIHKFINRGDTEKKREILYRVHDMIESIL